MRACAVETRFPIFFFLETLPDELSWGYNSATMFVEHVGKNMWALQWGSNGAPMGFQWGSNGAPMGLQWYLPVLSNNTKLKSTTSEQFLLYQSEAD